MALHGCRRVSIKFVKQKDAPMKKTLAGILSLALGIASLSLAETGVYLATKGSKAPPAPAAIALKVVPAPETAPVEGFPVSTGVPFADGQLGRDGLDRLRLVGADGKPVPAQFSVRGTYPRSGNIRWLGVDFQLASSASAYSLQLGAGPGPPHPLPVRVDASGDALVVSTGELKAEVPKQGGMLRLVWIGSELVIDQRAVDGNWLTTVDGKRWGESRREDTRAAVETEGPLHTVIRVDGRYVDEAGNPTCRWTARLHFYAGRPEIGLTHTFTWIGRADQFKIRDLAISFGLARAATEAAADRSDESADPVRQPLRAGEMLSLLQDEHWHCGRGESHFGILAGKPDQPVEVASGEKAGAWVGVSNGRSAVTLALRALWQQFPKELRAEPNRLTAYLWSSSGKAGAFDLSYDGLERFWGTAVVDQLTAGGQQSEGYRRARSTPHSNDPTGLAKTHDLLLIFARPAVGWDSVPTGLTGSGQSPNLRRCAEVAKAFDAPPLVLPDPRWTLQSDVIGRLWPKDEQRFAAWEQWIDTTWSDLFRVLDDWGDYGFFAYGDGPHQTYTFPKGRAVASIWRYTQAADYGVHKAAWLGWLRSGDRRFYDFALARTRFFNDIVMCHEESPSRWKGSFAGGFAPMPWSSSISGGRVPVEQKVLLFEFFIEHALIHYYLTGDRRSLDVAAEYAQASRDTIASKPDWAQQWVATMNNSQSRWYFQRLDDLAVLYEQFGDPWFYDKSVELAEAGLEPADSSGIVRETGERGGAEKARYPTYLFYKAPNLLSYLRNLRGAELDKARQAFIKTAEHQFRTQSLETRMIGPRMAYAYYFTRDQRYLAFGLKRMEEEMRRVLRPLRVQMGAKGYATAPGRAEPVNALLNAAHMMAALAECPNPADGPPVPLLLKHLVWPAVDFAFLKEPGQPLEIEMAASAVTYTSPDGKPLPEAWLGPAIAYYAHNDGIRLLNSDLPLLYRRITVPAGAPAGEVRIRVDKTGMAYVLSTSATRAVMIAPDGFHVGGGFQGSRDAIVAGGGYDDRWHFRVPGDAPRFRISTNGVQRPTIRDPQGAAVQTTPLGGGCYEIAVPKDAAGKLWSISAGGAVDVRFADIQPAFANRDPTLYFVPEGVPVVRDLPTIPEAGIKVRRRPPPAAPAPAKPQRAPQRRQPGGGQPATTSGQQPRSARDVWAERADQWHKAPLSLKTPAFAIAENLYYVGNKQFSSHLLVGSKEIVLIDTPYPTHFDMLTESIRSVGVDPKRVTLILHTHGHYDHYGATRRLVDLSGAKTALAAPDLGQAAKPHVIEPGIRRFVEQQGWLYEPFDVDILLKHGDTFDIGGTVIHCHHTPGHTKGTMTFTFDVLINSQKHTAVLWGGPGLHMFKSDQADDWARSFACLKALKADVPLGAHPFVNDTLPKHEKLKAGAKPNPFIDPDGWRAFLEKQEAEFQQILAKLNANPK